LSPGRIEPRSETHWHGTRVRLLAGDITQISVDAVINAANSALAGGGGVDGATLVRTWLSTHRSHGIEDIIFVLRGTDVMVAFRGAMDKTQRETR
jgi:hypothetical protein